MFRRIRAATRLVYLLDGGALELDPELAEIAELRAGAVSGAFPAVTVDRATAALRSNEVVLAVQGQRGLGKKLLLQLAAAHWNQRAARDRRQAARRSSRSPRSSTTVRALVRELMLLDALPAFVDVDDAVVADAAIATRCPAFFDTVPRRVARPGRDHDQPRAHAAHPPAAARPPHARGAAARTCAPRCGSSVVPSLTRTGCRRPRRAVRDPRRRHRRRGAGRRAPGGMPDARAAGRRRSRLTRSPRSSTSASRASARSCRRRSTSTI